MKKGFCKPFYVRKINLLRIFVYITVFLCHNSMKGNKFNKHTSMEGIMKTERAETDRVVSFSYKPYDKIAYTSIEELKAYGKQRGISFSFLVLKSIRLLLKELSDESGQG